MSLRREAIDGKTKEELEDEYFEEESKSEE